VEEGGVQENRPEVLFLATADTFRNRFMTSQGNWVAFTTAKISFHNVSFRQLLANIYLSHSVLCSNKT
jgi:hypothetical protein